MPCSSWVSDHARADRVHGDVVLGQLVRRDVGHRDHRALARGIGRVGGLGVALAGDRGDVDDPPAPALRHHLPRDPLRAEEHALGVDPVQPVPGRLADLEEAAVLGERRVVHQNVDAFSSPHGALDQGVDVIEIAQVRRHGEAAPAHLLDRAAGLLRRCRSMSAIATSAPACASAIAAALPMPRPAPVTSAIFPSSDIS